MSTIEQAARRLEELRRAGIDIPAAPDGSRAGSIPVPEQLVRALGAGRGAKKVAAVDTPEAAARSPGESGPKVEIDLTALTRAGVISPDASRSRIADEFRVIKRPLLDNIGGRSAAPVKRANLVMITSALAGEGKTFTAINLAMSIAMELDHTVLLVDADVARPALLNVLGLPSTPGLLDVLTDPKMTLSDVLLRTNVPRLTLLPAGSSHPRATELIASQAMASLVDELATRYHDRVIVFDTPPLLQTTESRVLASHMGQILVVVAADRTTHGTLRHALHTLQECPVVMTMLNKATRLEDGAYYYHYQYDDGRRGD